MGKTIATTEARSYGPTGTDLIALFGTFNELSDAERAEWAQVTDITTVKTGDIAYVSSAGNSRRGVITKVGRTRITVAYTTRSAIEEMRRQHPGTISVTNIPVDMGNVRTRTAPAATAADWPLPASEIEQAAALGVTVDPADLADTEELLDSVAGIVQVSVVDVLWGRQAVFCPKCKALPGHPCMSTGGGNPAEVAIHVLRSRRIQSWPEDFAARAGQAAKSVYRKRADEVPAEMFAEFEAAATPIPAEPVRPLTPKGVQLTDKQAADIELWVMCGGVGTVSTAHFSGDHQDRQTANALEAKGILEFVEMDPDHYGRIMELTAFGWQVYRQHRLIIRRLSEAEVDALQAQAAAARADAVSPVVDTLKAVDDAVAARIARTRAEMYEAIGDALAAPSGRVPAAVSDHVRGCLEDAAMVQGGRPTARGITLYAAEHGLSATVRERPQIEQLRTVARSAAALLQARRPGRDTAGYAVGDRIHGRCVTMQTEHVGTIALLVTPVAGSGQVGNRYLLVDTGETFAGGELIEPTVNALEFADRALVPVVRPPAYVSDVEHDPRETVGH